MLNERLGFKKIASLAGAIIVLLIVLLSASSLLEHLDAQSVMVIQNPFTGTLTWYTDPGLKVQFFGTVTKYPRRAQFWFSADPNQGQAADQSITIRFNDGGHAKVSGSVSYSYPPDIEHLSLLHKEYGSAEAIERQLIETTLQKSIYMTGPLLSSKESYAERRSELSILIEDQAQHGIYRTETKETKITDPLSGEQKTVKVVELIKDSNGTNARQEPSPLERFKITTSNLSINKIAYDPTVEAQIQSQQKAIMDVQTAAAQAKKAEQDAITAQKSGEAEAAKAKWEQEKIKATEVTRAEQELAVAKLNRETAEQKKQEQILIGQGEAEKSRLVMQANGALEQKLEAYKYVHEQYAKAIGSSQMPLVPSVIMGSSSGNNASSVTGLIDMLQAKTAQELGLQLTNLTPHPQQVNKK